MKKFLLKDNILPFLALFTSLSTIFCCALPIILVTLGMGAVFASLSSNIPAITFLAENVVTIFSITGILLAISGYMIFIRPQSCPINPKLATICIRSKKINKIVWWLSVVILGLSLFFKYILILFL
jgi:hypothetical protein